MPFYSKFIYLKLISSTWRSNDNQEIDKIIANTLHYTFYQIDISIDKVKSILINHMKNLLLYTSNLLVKIEPWMCRTIPKSIRKIMITSCLTKIKFYIREGQAHLETRTHVILFKT